jgi:hypothetical protein
MLRRSTVTARKSGRTRLIERHVRHGKSPDEARTWALGTDANNAGLIAATRHRADAIILMPAFPRG